MANLASYNYTSAEEYLRRHSSLDYNLANESFGPPLSPAAARRRKRTKVLYYWTKIVRARTIIPGRIIAATVWRRSLISLDRFIALVSAGEAGVAAIRGRYLLRRARKRNERMLKILARRERNRIAQVRGRFVAWLTIFLQSAAFRNHLLTNTSLSDEISKERLWKVYGYRFQFMNIVTLLLSRVTLTIQPGFVKYFYTELQVQTMGQEALNSLITAEPWVDEQVQEYAESL